MTQTTQEKLRLIADALDAGEDKVFGLNCEYDIYEAMRFFHRADFRFSRIPKPPAQIKVGNRTINAPLRVMPKEGAEYWTIFTDIVHKTKWLAGKDDLQQFHFANCWATEQDAKAYADAALAVRKGEV